MQFGRVAQLARPATPLTDRASPRGGSGKLDAKQMSSTAAAAAAKGGAAPGADERLERERAARDEQRLAWFRSRLEQLCDARLVGAGASSAPAREQLLYAVFFELQKCRPKLQFEVIELLASLFDEKRFGGAALAQGCGSLLHLLLHTIELTAMSTAFADDMRAAIHTKLFWLVGLVGREHCTVKDVNRMYRLLQRVVERNAPAQLTPLLLTALNDMTLSSIPPASPSSAVSGVSGVHSLPGPAGGWSALGYAAGSTASGGSSVYFDFAGSQPSALIVPRIDGWSPAVTAKGYTFAAWLWWEPDELDLSMRPAPGAAVGAAAVPPIAPPSAAAAGRGDAKAGLVTPSGGVSPVTAAGSNVASASPAVASAVPSAASSRRGSSTTTTASVASSAAAAAAAANARLHSSASNSSLSSLGAGSASDTDPSPPTSPDVHAPAAGAPDLPQLALPASNSSGSSGGPDSGRSGASSAPATPYRYVYSLMTSKGHGVEMLVAKKTGEVLLRSVTRSGKHELNTKVCLPPRRWVFAAVTHAPPSTFSLGGGGACRLFLNNTKLVDASLAFPQLTSDALTFGCVGANTVNQFGAANASYRGRIGACSLFATVLTKVQATVLFERGPEFCVRPPAKADTDWLSNTLSTIMTAISGDGAASRDAAQRAKQLEQAMREALGAALFLYHPKNVERQTAVDASFLFHTRAPLDATMSQGVNVVATTNIRDAIQCCVGGITSLFPLVAHIDVMSPAPADALTTARLRGGATLLPLWIRTLNRLLDGSASNQRQLLSTDGLSALGHLLAATAPRHLNAHVVTALQELARHCAWLVAQSVAPPSSAAAAASSAPSADAKAAGATAASAGSFALGASTSLSGNGGASASGVPFAAPNGGSGNGGAGAGAGASAAGAAVSKEAESAAAASSLALPTLPVATARHATLFNALLQHVLLNPAIWLRPGVAFNVQCGAVGALESYIKRQPEYFREAIGFPAVLDLMRRHLSYDRCDTVTALQHTAALNAQWLSALHALVVSGTKHHNASDVQHVMQALSEWHDPVHVAQLCHLLNTLLMRYQSSMYRLILNAGGVSLLLRVLARLSAHTVVQISCLQLIATLLRFGTHPHIAAALKLSPRGVFPAIAGALNGMGDTVAALAAAPHSGGAGAGASDTSSVGSSGSSSASSALGSPLQRGVAGPTAAAAAAAALPSTLSVVTYHTLIELLCGLNSGQLSGVTHPIEYHVACQSDVLRARAAAAEDAARHQQSAHSGGALIVVDPHYFNAAAAGSGASPSPSPHAHAHPPAPARTASVTPPPGRVASPAPDAKSAAAAAAARGAPTMDSKGVDPAVVLASCTLKAPFVKDGVEALLSLCAPALGGLASLVSSPSLSSVDATAAAAASAPAGAAVSGSPPATVNACMVLRDLLLLVHRDDNAALLLTHMPMWSKPLVDRLDWSIASGQVASSAAATAAGASASAGASLQLTAAATVHTPEHELAKELLEYMLVFAIATVKDGWVHLRNALVFMQFAADEYDTEGDMYRAIRRSVLSGVLATLVRLHAHRTPKTKLGLSTGVLYANAVHVLDAAEACVYDWDDVLRGGGRTAGAAVTVPAVGGGAAGPSGGAGPAAGPSGGSGARGGAAPRAGAGAGAGPAEAAAAAAAIGELDLLTGSSHGSSSSSGSSSEAKQPKPKDGGGAMSSLRSVVASVGSTAAHMAHVVRAKAERAGEQLSDRFHRLGHSATMPHVAMLPSASLLDGGDLPAAAAAAAAGTSAHGLGTDSKATVESNSKADGDAWVLCDENTDRRSAHTSEGLSAQRVVAEWPLVRQCLLTVQALGLSLRPADPGPIPSSSSSGSGSGGGSGGNGSSAASNLATLFNTWADGNSSSSNGNNAAAAAASLGGAGTQARTGSPLRVILRTLLDCIEAVATASESLDAAVVLPVLGEMLKACVAVMENELSRMAYDPRTANPQLDSVANRLWKNRYTVLVLHRLCAIHNATGFGTTPALVSPFAATNAPAVAAAAAAATGGAASAGAGAAGAGVAKPRKFACSLQTRQLLLQSVQQLVTSLRPFAVVTTQLFLSVAEQREMEAAAAAAGGGGSTPTAAGAGAGGGNVSGSSSGGGSNSSHNNAYQNVSVPVAVTTAGAGEHIVAEFRLSPKFSFADVYKSIPKPKSSTATAGAAPGAPPGAAAAPAASVALSPLEMAAKLDAVYAAALEHITSLSRSFYTLEQRLVHEFGRARDKLATALRKTLRGDAEEHVRGATELYRSGARLAVTLSYAEANRKAVADALQLEAVERAANAWRAIRLRVMRDGSPWHLQPVDRRERRTFWCIDSAEDGYRMRRKLRPFVDGVDHSRASGVGEAAVAAAAHERAVAANSAATAQHRKARAAATPAKPPPAPIATTAKAADASAIAAPSSAPAGEDKDKPSSQPSSQPPSQPHTPAAPTTPTQTARSVTLGGAATGAGSANTNTTGGSAAVAPAPGGAPLPVDEEKEHEKAMETMQRALSAHAVKTGTAGTGADGGATAAATEENDPDDESGVFDGAAAAAADAKTAPSAPAAVVASKPGAAGAASASGGSAGAATGAGAAAAPGDKPTLTTQGSGNKGDGDWDLCDDASTSATGSRSGTGSGGAAGAAETTSVGTAQSGNVFVCHSCTLVLPIVTIPGRLEIGAQYIEFRHTAANNALSQPPQDEPRGPSGALLRGAAGTKSPAGGAGAGTAPPALTLDEPAAAAPPRRSAAPKPPAFTLPSLNRTRRAAITKERRWALRDIQAVYRRRYQLRRTALEVFFVSSGKNVFLDFGTRDMRQLVLKRILALRPPNLIRLCSRPPIELVQRSALTAKWQRREISNFEYLMHLNTISGRTYNDLNQYPVFPWILSDYRTDAQVAAAGAAGAGVGSGDVKGDMKGARRRDSGDGKADGKDGSSSGSKPPGTSGGSSGSSSGSSAAGLSLPAITEIINAPHSQHHATVFRDLTKPVGALHAPRLESILERFAGFHDSAIPPFHYGSHYSNAAVVLFYLMRLEPFASLHIELQTGKFDYSDRLFSSLSQTWDNCMTSLSCFKELIPEFFYFPEFLENVNGYDLGVTQDGRRVSDVVLPRWARSTEEFVRVNRMALESEYVSRHLHHWIDLIFGYKQRGDAAKRAHNLFFHLTYEGAVDTDKITDPVLLDAVREQIAQFGQTPLQLFKAPHVARNPLPASQLAKLALSMPLDVLDASGSTTFHHPILLRTRLHAAEPVITISALPNRVVTIGQHFTLASHDWSATRLPGNKDKPANNADDEVVAVAPGGVKRPGASAPSLPFHYELAALSANHGNSSNSSNGMNSAASNAAARCNPPTAASVVVTWDGRHMVLGNNWDDSVRVHATTVVPHKHSSSSSPLPPSVDPATRARMRAEVRSTLVQHVPTPHRARITTVSLGRDGTTLVTGAADCTLSVWNVVATAKKPFEVVDSAPRHVLTGHDEPVVCAAIDTELDLCLSASRAGQLLVHSLRSGSRVRALTIPYVAPDAAAAAPHESPLPSTANAIAAGAAAAAAAASPAGASKSMERPRKGSLDAMDLGAEIKRIAAVDGRRASGLLQSPPLAGPAAGGKKGAPSSSSSSSRAGAGAGAVAARRANPEPVTVLTRLVAVAADGTLVFHTHAHKQQHAVAAAAAAAADPNAPATAAHGVTDFAVWVCNVNGRHWVSQRLPHALLCMAVSGDSKWLVTGSEAGEVLLRRLYDLQVVQRFERAGSGVSALAFSFDGHYLFAGTQSGDLLIFALQSF